MTALLEVEGLSVRLATADGYVTVVDDVDFAVQEGQVFGVAGESGSGKTMSALAVLRLLPPRAIVEGRAVYRGRDVFVPRPAQPPADPRPRDRDGLPGPADLASPDDQHRPRAHRAPARPPAAGKAQARARAIEMLDEVRIPDPEGCLSAFPHQFSGGMRQRIAIAIALICGPRLLIADEPTTALDVTVQAGIIRMLDRLRREAGLSVLLITHDLGVMSAIADVVSVMYAGRIVESGATREVIQQPRHPYTRGLLDALPHPEDTADRPLLAIPGQPPSARERPSRLRLPPPLRIRRGRLPHGASRR